MSQPCVISDRKDVSASLISPGCEFCLRANGVPAAGILPLVMRASISDLHASFRYGIFARAVPLQPFGPKCSLGANLMKLHIKTQSPRISLLLPQQPSYTVLQLPSYYPPHHSFAQADSSLLITKLSSFKGALDNTLHRR